MEHGTNKAVKAVTAAMTVNAVTDVMNAFDLPGLLAGVMDIPEVKEIVSAGTTEPGPY